MAAKSFRRYKMWRNAAQKIGDSRRERCPALVAIGRVDLAIKVWNKMHKKEVVCISNMLKVRDTLSYNGRVQARRIFGSAAA